MSKDRQFKERHLQKEIDELRHEIREIWRFLRPKTLTRSLANRFTGETSMNNVLVFNVGQSSVDTLTPFLADGVTPSGGVVSDVTVNFSDLSATAAVQSDNTILFTGVAASSGPVNGSASCTVTDTDSAVSTWNQAFTVTTNAPPPPSQLTQSVQNVFSVPTP